MAFTPIVSSQTVLYQTVIAGTQSIVNGGIANSTTINSGGVQRVSSGGKANATIIDSSGGQAIYGYAAVTSTYISGCGSWQQIFSGGSAIITTIGSAGEQYVNAGGTATSTIVDSEGGQTVSSGGIATSTTVSAGGYQLVYGVATQSLVQSGGFMMIGNGGNVSGFTISSGGNVGWDFNAVFSGTSNGVAVVSNSGKTSYNFHFCNLIQYVSSGYTTNSAAIGLGAAQHVFSGGAANNTSIQSGGAQYISSGGIATNTVVNCGSGGQWIYNGGTANITTINYSGLQYVSSGGTANSTTIDVGSQYIFSGGVANSTTINGGYQYISSGGIANSTTINQSGYLYISSGGMANSATINFSGYLYISSGGTGNSTTISNGGYLYISSGGIASNTIVNTGGTQIISSGGSADVIKQYHGGIVTDTWATITNGTNSRTDGHSAFSIISGVASNFLLEINGQLTVLSGHSAIDTTVNFGGTQNISSGGVARYTITSDGIQIIYSGGMASSTVTNGGCQYVSAGGVANYTTINSGCQYVSAGGVASCTTIIYGGLVVTSGGTASEINLRSGGTISANTGATITSGINTRIDGHSAFSIVNGIASNFLLAGRLDVLSGNSAIDTIITRGGLYISSGGMANSTTINNYGSQSISSGGIANSTTINSGGSQIVSAGGTASFVDQQAGAAIIADTGATITDGINTRTDGHSAFSIVNCITSNLLLENGGRLTILSSHSANDTVVASGGSQWISSGGTANSTTINGGSQVVYSGGVANSTTINSKSMQSVSCYGIVNLTTINSGGTQIVSASGTANSTTINYGGSQIVSAGGTASVINQQAGAIIAYTGATITGGINTRTDGHSNFSIISGVASNFLLENWGSLFVSSGHSANDTLIGYWGRQWVSSGGVANFTNINSGGSQDIYGTANSTTINFGGSQNINYSGVANYTSINSGGWQYVNYNGVANGTTISSGGYQHVCGTDSQSVIKSGGMLMIGNGGIANNFTVLSGGILGWNFNAILSGTSNGIAVVSSSGKTSYNLYLNGIAQIVSSGYTAISTTINAKGKQIVSSGGTASVINQLAGGAVCTNTGATVTNGTNTRTAGHSMFSIISGLASNFLLENGGALDVLSSNSAIDTVIASGGNLYVCSGGSANVVNQQTGGAVGGNTGGTIIGGINTRTDGHSSFSIISRIASNFLLENGGELDVGDSAIDTVIASGGSQNIYWNGVANSTTINSGGNQSAYSGGVANSTTINSGGGQYVGYNGVANSTIINAGAQQYISSGGVVNSTTINSGGNQNVYFSSLANFTMINAGGRQCVYISAAVNNTTINSGGSQIVVGFANCTTINSGGSQIVSGGMAGNNIINSGGNQVIYYGMASSTTINSGGNQIVSSGSAINTTISSGGSMYVTGGIVSGTLTIAGGHVVLDTATSVSNLTTMSYFLATAKTNDVLTTVNGWTLGTGITAYSLNLDKAAAGNYILVSGADLSGMNSKSFTITYNNQNVSLQVGSSYVFANGNKLSLNFTDAATDQLTATISVMDITPPTLPSSLKQTVTGSNVALDWADATDATSGVKQYEVQVDKNNNFSSPEYSASSATSNMDITGATDGTYFWRVRTQDNAGNYSSWTGGSSFTVDITAPAVPAALTRTVTGSNAALDWADATDATSGVKQYEFQIDNNSDFSSNEKSGTITASNTNVTGLADGNYYWRVRTQDNAGNYSSWTGGSNFTVDITAPAVPAALTRTVTGSNAALDWVDATDATSGVKQYEVQVDNNNNFSSPEYSAPSAISSTNLSGMADGNYYWRVRTQDNSGNYSNWSSGTSFTVDTAAPAIPAALTSTVTGSNVALDWADATDATSGVKQYEVQLDDSNDFSSPVNTLTPAASTATVTSLSDGTYYWRVRTQDNSGNYSDWSSGTSFMIDATAPAVPAALTRTVTGSNVALDWADAADTTSGIKQYDVQVDNNSNFSSPEYSKQITSSQTSVENLAPGTYYWRVRTQDNSGNWSAWSTGADFTVDLTTPTVPGGLKQTVTGSSVAFAWNDSTDASGIRQYEIRVDNNSDFSSPEYSKLVDASAASASLALGTYYWQVRAQDKSGNYSAWSSSSKFVVTPTDTAGNTWQTANDIASLDNWVGYGDPADFYKLTMTNAGTLTLGLTGLTGNADLSLLSATGAVLKTSANAGPANESIVQSLLAGIYYVKIAAGTSVNDASYTLNHTEKYCPTDTAANTWQSAGDISNLDNWVGFGDAADFYKLTMTNAGTLTLGLTGLTGNADLSLLSATGTVLKSSSNTGTTPEAINNVALLAGTYYVKVAAGTSVNDASYTLSNTIKYCPTDKAANDYKTALDISNLDNWVGFGDATDFYKLTMANAGTLTLGLTGLTGNADLSLLNSAGTVLKSSSNTGNTSEAINNVALLAGTYYVKVAAGTSVNDASYTLSNAIKYCPTDKAANDYKTALDISTLDNWVGFGDAADFYKLTMNNAGTLSLGLTGLTGNADLSLLNSAGTVLKSSSNTGTTSEAINNVALLAGTYYVKVAAGTSVNDASYTLSNTIKYCPTDTAANDYATAKDIKAGVDNWVGFGDAADFYKLTMTNAGTLSLDLTGLTSNVDMSLLSSTGTVLKSSANTGITNEAISSVSLLAGTYYVKIATGFGINDARYTLSDLEKYFPLDNAGSTQGTAKLVDSPTQTGWVGFGDSDDYYRFDLANTAQETLRLHDMTGGNADLTLYDSKGTMLQKSANTGALEDTITRNLAAGTYYARVTAVSGNIDYKLDFSKKDIVSGMLAS